MNQKLEGETRIAKYILLQNGPIIKTAVSSTATVCLAQSTVPNQVIINEADREFVLVDRVHFGLPQTQ